MIPAAAPVPGRRLRLKGVVKREGCRQCRSCGDDGGAEECKSGLEDDASEFTFDLVDIAA